MIFVEFASHVGLGSETGVWLPGNYPRSHTYTSDPGPRPRRFCLLIIGVAELSELVNLRDGVVAPRPGARGFGVKEIGIMMSHD